MKKPVVQQQSVALPPEFAELLALFTDTTCTSNTGTSTWEATYQLFEDEEPRVTERVVIAEDSYPVSDTTYSDLANSFLHRIVAQLNILPYMDMITCVVDHLNIADRNFMTKRNTIIGSFTNKDSTRMYQFSAAQKKYDNDFIEKFMKENQDQSEVIKGWRRDASKHKRENKGMHSIASLVGPYCYVATMICRLFGYVNTQKFSDQWVPLIDAAMLWTGGLFYLII